MQWNSGLPLWTSQLTSRLPWAYHARTPRRRYTRLLVVVSGLILLVIWYRNTRVDYHHNNTDFQSLSLAGYINVGGLKLSSCDDIRHAGEIAVGQRLTLDDDIYAIADSLDDHPMIDYSGQDESLTREEMVGKTWHRMAQSSVWMQNLQVYLTVTRVFFYVHGVLHWPVISFVRGQIHDANWNELRDYRIEWQGQSILFPRIFDVNPPYNQGGGFYGPEDPRIIMKQNVNSGTNSQEPVIIFNMMADPETKDRAMYIHRPFSNSTIKLFIAGENPRNSEKNWMPFFYEVEDSDGADDCIHFVYEFEQLRILKCDLMSGECSFVHAQEIPDDFQAERQNFGSVMRGGTNFHPLSLIDGVQSFVGFPRTHVVPGCKDALYRPELMVLAATSSSQFHIDFLSESLDFNIVSLASAGEDRFCGDGRVLIVNSIARWDLSKGNDVMVISFTVDDFTTEVLMLQGVGRFLKQILDIAIDRQPDMSTLDPDYVNAQWSVPGQDVLQCSVEAANNYALAQIASANWTQIS